MLKEVPKKVLWSPARLAPTSFTVDVFGQLYSMWLLFPRMPESEVPEHLRICVSGDAQQRP